MNGNDVERALGLDTPHQERVIDAEVVSPKRIKRITTISMIMSMSAVAAAAWFAGSSMTQSHRFEPVTIVEATPLPDDLLRIADLEAFASTVEEREETYRVLFEGLMDRLESMENRAHNAERAIAALLPMIGAAITGASAGEQAADAAPSTEETAAVKPAVASPRATQETRPTPPRQENVQATPIATPAPVTPPVAATTLPQPVPRVQPTQPFDETALPFVVVDLDSKGIRLVSDTELLDSDGKPVGIGSVVSGLEGRLLRVSASEQLIVTDKKIYVIE